MDAEAGPYAKVLAGEIANSGIEAVRMVGNEQWRVRAATMQEPYLPFNALSEVFLGQAGRGGLSPRPTDAPGRLAPFQTSDEKISIGHRRIVGGDVSNLGAAKSCALRSVAYLIHSEMKKDRSMGAESNCGGGSIGTSRDLLLRRHRRPIV
jgi:hypothetical protein